VSLTQYYTAPRLDGFIADVGALGDFVCARFGVVRPAAETQ
jgi:hypothetical protein